MIFASVSRERFRRPTLQLCIRHKQRNPCLVYEAEPISWSALCPYQPLIRRRSSGSTIIPPAAMSPKGTRPRSIKALTAMPHMAGYLAPKCQIRSWPKVMSLDRHCLATARPITAPALAYFERKLRACGQYDDHHLLEATAILGDELVKPAAERRGRPAPQLRPRYLQQDDRGRRIPDLSANSAPMPSAFDSTSTSRAAQDSRARAPADM